MLLSLGRYVLLGIAIALLVGALAPTGLAAAQPQPPTLSVEPPSGPCHATVTVSGQYFLPSPDRWPPALTLYLVQPGTADVSMETLGQADFPLNVMFFVEAHLREHRGCEAATLDSRLERPTGHLTFALAEGEPVVQPGDRIPNIISVAEYAYETTAPPPPEPTMALSPSSGPCDGRVEVTGRDFPPSTAIFLFMGTPNSDGRLGRLASLVTGPGGDFATEVSLGSLGCRAASLDHYHSGQLSIGADLENRVITGEGMPPILTRTGYAYTTTAASSPPQVLPSTGSGPSQRLIPPVWLALVGGLGGVGLILLVASLYRSRRLRS